MDIGQGFVEDLQILFFRILVSSWYLFFFKWNTIYFIENKPGTC